MEERILVMDNLVSKETLGIIMEEISCMQWMQEQSNGVPGDPETSGTFFKSLTTQLPSHRYLFKFFCKTFNLNLECIRSYVNLNPPNSSGAWHTDDGELTLLFFPQKSWMNAYGGATEFYDHKKVNYAGNRLIIFDAGLKHRAEKNMANFNRYSIAWKTKKI